MTDKRLFNETILEKTKSGEEIVISLEEAALLDTGLFEFETQEEAGLTEEDVNACILDYARGAGQRPIQESLELLVGNDMETKRKFLESSQFQLSDYEVTVEECEHPEIITEIICKMVPRVVSEVVCSRTPAGRQVCKTVTRKVMEEACKEIHKRICNI